MEDGDRADSPDERDDLETGGDDLGFTVKLDTEHVEHQERDTEDGDPDGGVQVGPVGDDDRTCAQLAGYG